MAQIKSFYPLNLTSRRNVLLLENFIFLGEKFEFYPEKALSIRFSTFKRYPLDVIYCGDNRITGVFVFFESICRSDLYRKDWMRNFTRWPTWDSKTEITRISLQVKKIFRQDVRNKLEWLQNKRENDTRMYQKVTVVVIST